jgi:hypothetical protein
MQKFIGLFVVFLALATPAFSGDGRYQIMKTGDAEGYSYIVLNTNNGQTRLCLANYLKEPPKCSPWNMN